MGESVRVDNPAFAASAESFGELANSLSDAGARLKSALAAEGACWGFDDPGAEFVGTYQPMFDAAVRKIELVVSGSAKISVGITTAAAGYVDTDAAVADSLTGNASGTH